MSDNNRIYNLEPSDDVQLKLEAERKQALAVCTELNVNTNTLRQNSMFVCFKCIRNGIILILFSSLVLLINNLLLSRVEQQNEFVEGLRGLNQNVREGFASIKSEGELIRETIISKAKEEQENTNDLDSRVPWLINCCEMKLQYICDDFLCRDIYRLKKSP